MRQVRGDFGEVGGLGDYLPTVSKNSLPKISYTKRTGRLGRMPDDYRTKSYMVFGRYEHDFLEEYGHAFGWGFKISFPKIKINTKKFFNALGKAFTSVVDMVKETIEAAKKVVKAVTPPALHKYIDIVVNPIPLITNPTSTIAKLLDPQPFIEVIKNPMPQIAHVLDPAPKIAAVKYAYKNVLKPVYKSAMNVTAELALKPVNNILDESVYKVLPSHLADKLNRITDIPEAAARGKITDKMLLDACEAYAGIIAMPTAVAGYFSNSVIDWAKKDALLGPVIKTLDKYSGGLVTSAQNLANTGQEVYFERDIDWKKKILDGVKVYLAVTSASAFAQSMATNYVGTQSGLNKTPIGRDVLIAGRAYLTGGLDAGFTTDVALNAGTAVLSETAKREIIIEAAKKGIIDRKTLEDVIKYGTAIHGTQNPDGTYNSEALVEMSKDGIYQEFIREEVKKRTGLDLSMKDLSDIYGYAMDPQELLDNANAAIDKAITDRDQWEENVEKAYQDAIKDYEDFDLKEFVENEMPRFEQNVKDELTRYGQGHVDDFIKWVVSKIGPEKAKDPKNYTPELLTEYERRVIDLTGSPVPKKGKLNPLVFGAGIAIMAGAALLIAED